MKMNRLRDLLFVSLYICCCQVCAAQALWIQNLVDSLISESDLCINCQRVSPRITSGVFMGQKVHFLRYGCDVNDFFTQMRDENGNVIGSCILSPDESVQCTNPQIDVLIAFTFIAQAQLIWTCEEGFLCEYAQENNIQDSLRIMVNDEQCAIGKKELFLAANYQNYQWEGPSQNSIETSLTIDQTGLYSVTATDVMGCSKVGDLLISSLDSLTVDLFAPSSICVGDTFSIFTNQFESFMWSNGSTDSILRTNIPGEYTVTVTRGLGCIGTNKVNVNTLDEIEFSLFSEETTINLGDTVDLIVNGLSDGDFKQIIWSNNTNENCVDCQETSVIPTESSIYSIRVIDANGCFKTTDINITVFEEEIKVYTPNAVYLNGAAENRQFGIFGNPSITIDELDVFDRWGNLVFSIRNVQVGDDDSYWNGALHNTIVEEGVYTYRTRLSNLNGQESIILGDFVLFQ